MKVDQKGHTTILKNTQGDCEAFLEKVTTQHNSFKNQNLILDMSMDKEVKLKQIKLFSDLSKTHKKGKKSFVMVVQDIDFNDVPTKLTVVPTLLEAHDIIEMEEIERDLGF
ncbi:MAG TPA: ribonuclease Z [Flavobacterium sp.]|uniref:ribonuclease Z n=1 Tax=unclassified Flavobacterium TaxID=196869 RepID=UPI000E7EF0EC|nr:MULTISPECIES: ribonuclease Z [unclassified Flavobacterium]HBI00217.1 ribonuclease Z [Flavobacterium sp.]HRE77182.1 ribonuclease Z [Flavobacterium sp.]